MPEKTFDVAVRPTAEEVKVHQIWYDQDYYEDRAVLIEARSPEEAIDKYINKMRRSWLHQSEIRFIRAKEVSDTCTSVA